MTDLSSKYEDIDVMSSVMETATSQATAKTIPQDVVDRLKRQVADEAGLELRQDLESAEAVKTPPVKTGPTEEEEAKVSDQLRAMRAAHEM
jgi:charged multivesicular body protein 1